MPSSNSRTRVLDSFADKIFPRKRSPSPRRRRSSRSRSRSRGRHADKARIRRSPQRQTRRSNSRTDLRQSDNNKRERRSSQSPKRSTRAHSPPNHKDRRRERSRSVERKTTTGKSSSRKCSRSRSRSPVSRTAPARSPVLRNPTTRRQSKSPQNKNKVSEKKGRGSLTPSPTTLDEVLLKETPLSSSRTKSSISQRYEKYDINVIAIHSKGKKKRTQDEIDSDGSAEDFSPTDVIELVHELNPKAKSAGSRSKKVKCVFDREEITSFKEEEVETKVIRVLPSADDLHKIEAKLNKSERKDSERQRSTEGKGYRDGKKEKKSGSSKDNELGLLRREPERRRYNVTDDDLLGDSRHVQSSKADIETQEFGVASMDRRDKRIPISQRLGASADSREHNGARRIDERLGRDPRDRDPRERDRNLSDTRDRRDTEGRTEGRRGDRYPSTDLRHNLSSRVGQDESTNRRGWEPMARDYGHHSMDMEAQRERQRTPDFSKRPGKGQIDMMALDPTYVPRNGRYMEHDNRDSFSFAGSRSFRGGFRGRGGIRARREDRFMDKRETRSYRPRVTDERQHHKTGGKHMDTWKHDKFNELEDELDRKAEPSSTTG